MFFVTLENVPSFECVLLRSLSPWTLWGWQKFFDEEISELLVLWWKWSDLSLLDSGITSIFEHFPFAFCLSSPHISHCIRATLCLLINICLLTVLAHIKLHSLKVSSYLNDRIKHFITIPVLIARPFYYQNIFIYFWFVKIMLSKLAWKFSED